MEIAAIPFTVTIFDDVPEVLDTKAIITDNDGSHFESGFLTEAILSNDVTSVSWDASALPPLVFEGKPVEVVDHGDGMLLGRLADGTAIFRVIIDTDVVDANNSPGYSFELLNSLGRLGIDGSAQTYTVISGGNIDTLSLGFGDFLIDTMTATAAGGGTATVNTNNNWIGVGGNWFDPGERLFMDFNDPTGTSGQVRGLDMLVEGQGGAPYQLQWTVTAAIDMQGNTVTYSGTFSGSGNEDRPFAIGLQNGAIYFTDIEVTSLSGQFRISFAGVTANDYHSAIPMDLGYTLTDADADSASGRMAITLDPDPLPPQNLAPTAQGGSVFGQEDHAAVLDWSQFGVSDADSSAASLGIRVTTLPVDGVLQRFNGTAWVGLAAGELVSKSAIDAGQLRFVPDADESGSNIYPTAGVGNMHQDYAHIEFVATDGQATSGPATLVIDIAPSADQPTLHAHLSPLVSTGTTLFTENFSDGNFTSPAWTRVKLFDNTFTDQPASGKSQSEASLFADNAWTGQTDNSEWNSFWTVRQSTISAQSLYYNRNGANGSDDAHGMLAYQNLSAGDRAMTSYSVSADMWGNTGSQQNNGLGLVFGYQDAQNYFLVRWENMGVQYQPGGSLFDSYPGQANQLSLVQMVNGQPVDLGALDNFNTASWFNLRVEVTVAGIRVFANDGTATYNGSTPQITYAYGSVAGGVAAAPALATIGLWVFDDDTGVAFDNVSVQSLDYTYHLDLQAFLNDTDGSESLSPIFLSGIPDGVSLTAANGAEISVTGGAATIPVSSGVETTLTVHSTTPLTPTQVNAITASVTATESLGGSSTTTEHVQVDLIGTGSGETLTGTAAGEWVDGSGGNDRIIGGAGDDNLLGGLGSDTFAWRLADAGPSGSPAHDAVVDFNTATGTDVLDLRDLLQSENAGNLTHYLHFERTDAGTVVHVSAGGGFAGGYSAAQENQSITLEGVDLFNGGLTTDQQVIQDLLARGKLITD